MKDRPFFDSHLFQRTPRRKDVSGLNNLVQNNGEARSVTACRQFSTNRSNMITDFQQ